jgi:hypothetical protein
MQDANEKESILIVTAVASVPEGKNLIPLTAIQGENDITEIELMYSVAITNEITDEDDLNVEVTNIKIGNSEIYAHIVNVSIEKNLNDKNEFDIDVKVSIDEPETLEVYQFVKNREITFDLLFTANT